MQYVRHELERLKEALNKEGISQDERFALYLAQVTLSWVLNPNMHHAPYDVITNPGTSDPGVEEQPKE